jgi:Uma2 family endonuclease
MSTKALLTSEDLWKIVADGSRYELYRGELVPMTPVGFEHGKIVIRFGRLLDEYVEKNRLGAVGTEVGFHLLEKPDTTLAPDIAFIEQGRIPQGSAAQKFVEFAPDLAVEVLSPWDTATEITRKIEVYLTAGVRLVWIVDPGTQRVSVYRSLQDVKVLTPPEELEGGDVLPGFQIKVSEIFAI